jgi:hypothetical protein
MNYEVSTEIKIAVELMEDIILENLRRKNPELKRDEIPFEIFQAVSEAFWCGQNRLRIIMTERGYL